MIEVFRHNSWANRRLIDFCRDLDPGVLSTRTPGTYGSIKDTLAHLVRMEETYASTVEGTSPPATSSGFISLDDLSSRVSRLADHWDRCLDPEPHPERLVERHYRGGKQLVPIATVLVQVISHAGEHRAQVCTALGTIDIEPPALDGWTFGDWLREQRQQQRV
jgi:uncharacterized damage-inducible protein DinB